MPLKVRLAGRGHSIQRFEDAGKARFREGQALVIAGHRLAGIYLFGYSIEMILKAAYFRLIVWSRQRPITMDDLKAVRSRAVTLYGRQSWAGNLHDLMGWVTLLIMERRQRGRAFPPSITRALRGKVFPIAKHWSPDLRYHAARPYAGEVSSVFAASFWIVGQSASL